jgi:hypothetical protein
MNINTKHFVITLKEIKNALKGTSSEGLADGLIHEIQSKCSHAKADRVQGVLSGKCMDCQKIFPHVSAKEHLCCSTCTKIFGH